MTLDSVGPRNRERLGGRDPGLGGSPKEFATFRGCGTPKGHFFSSRLTDLNAPLLNLDTAKSNIEITLAPGETRKSD